MKTTNYLKTFVLILTLMFATHEGYGQNPDSGNPVILKGKTYEGGGEAHKSPVHGPTLPNVWFNPTLFILTFEGPTSLDGTPIYIYDEEENLVFTSSIIFDADGVFQVNLSTLPDSLYILVIEVNGKEYAGTFCK